MTTVINLSLFNLNLNRPSLGNLFSDRSSSGKSREELIPREQVIDVTPQSRVAVDDNLSKDSSVSAGTAERLHNLSIVNVTYDRNGRIIEHVNAKGMLLSSYA